MHFVSIGFYSYYTLTLLLFTILFEVMSSTAQHQYTDDHLLAGKIEYVKDHIIL